MKIIILIGILVFVTSTITLAQVFVVEPLSVGNAPRWAWAPTMPPPSVHGGISSTLSDTLSETLLSGPPYFKGHGGTDPEIDWFCNSCHGNHIIDTSKVTQIDTSKVPQKLVSPINSTFKLGKQKCLDCHEKRLGKFTRDRDSFIIIKPSSNGKIHLQ